MIAQLDTPLRAGSRVLIAHPSGDLFGSDRMMLESVGALVDAGHEVVVTLPSGGPLIGEIERRGATTRFCPTPVLRRNLLRPLGLVRLAAQSVRGVVAGLRLIRREQPDVVYVNTVTIPLWLAIARITGRPAVAHVHEAERSAPSLVRRALATPLLLARTIVSNSAYCVDVIAGEYPALRQRSEVIPNGISGPAHAPPARPALEDSLRVAYIGRLSARKGIDVAISAVAELRAEGFDASLDVVGSAVAGNEGIVQDLRTLADALGLDGAVRFIGYRSDVWSVLADHDVLVVPSRLEEGFGNTAVEGILAARPIVVSDTSGLREASAGYASAQQVAAGDPVALHDALRAVIEQWDRFRSSAADDRRLALAVHATSAYGARIAAAVDRTRAVGIRSALGGPRDRWSARHRHCVRVRQMQPPDR